MKKLKWKVQFEIEVDPMWVQNGFNLTKERLLASLGNDSLVEDGIKNIVIEQAPDPKLIQWLQGYFDEQGAKTDLELGVSGDDRMKCQAKINRKEYLKYNDNEDFMKEFNSRNSY